MKLDHLNIDLNGDGVAERYDIGGASTANELPYDNSGSGLSSTTTQEAIDEVNNNINSKSINYSLDDTNEGITIDGGFFETKIPATDILFNNSVGGLSANNIQDAVDQVNAKADSALSKVSTPNYKQKGFTAQNFSSGTTYTLASLTLEEGVWIVFGYGLLIGDMYITDADLEICRGRNNTSSVQNNCFAYVNVAKNQTKTVNLNFACSGACNCNVDSRFYGMKAIRII